MQPHFSGRPAPSIPAKSTEYLLFALPALRKIITVLLVYSSIEYQFGTPALRLTWVGSASGSDKITHCRLITILGDRHEVYGPMPLIGFIRQDATLLGRLWKTLTPDRGSLTSL